MSLLGLHPDTTIQKDACIPAFTAAKMKIQPKCTSADKWTKKMRCIYMRWNISHKKNEIMPFAATWRQLESIILNELSQNKKDKYHMISLIFGI